MTGRPACSRTSTRSGCPRDYTRRDVPRGGRRARSRARGAERRRPRVAQPAGPGRAELPDAALRLLFVGGTISRKGVDVLLSAYELAFAGRDDVAAGDQGSRRLELLPRHDDVRPAARACRVGRAAARPLHRRRADARRARSALPGLRRARAPLSRRGLRDAGARGDGVRAPGRGDRRRADGRVLPGRRLLAHPVRAARAIADGRVGNLETIAPPWMLEPDRDALVGILHEVASRCGRAHPPRRACPPGRRAVLLGLGRRHLRRSHPRARTAAATRPGAGRAARAGRRARARAARDAGLAWQRPPRRPAARLGCRLPCERAGRALPAGRSGRRRGARAVGVPRA